MRNIRKMVTGLFAVCIIMLAFQMPVYAAGNQVPTAKDNRNIGLRSTSELVATRDGYMRVYYDGTQIGIEYYDDNFEMISKKKLAMELERWGGFYAGSGAYYIVEGRNNIEENDAAEVIRVIKYDTNWRRLGAAKITGDTEFFGGEVRFPFDAGCVEMAEHNGILYIVTGHEGYVDSLYGQGHQGFLMLAVDTATMTGQMVDANLWHSFAQYIKSDDTDLYVLEQSEGSRYTSLSKYTPGDMQRLEIPVFKYGGSRDSAWSIACFASVNDMALSAANILGLGTSIDQTKYDSVTKDTAHNIYLTVTPKSDFSESATKVKWLTNYTGGGKAFYGTKITKINDNRFLVSWEEADTERKAEKDDTLSKSILHYVFIDGNGNKLTGEYKAAAPISDCQPIVKGSNIVYYASNANMVNFYTINTQTGAFSKKTHRVAGENATWELENHVLKMSGTGTLEAAGEAVLRMPTSTTSGIITSYGNDNAWSPIRSNVEKIVIGTGITSIADGEFAYFENLEEVEIQPGLQSIGKEAFSYCDKLNKIIIPNSVTSIGEDFLWTGWLWGDGTHVTGATIYAPAGSYAAKYAKKNHISYERYGKVSIANASVKGLNTSYVYTGKARKPKFSVRVNGETLKKGRDYTVSYSNNVKMGRATVRIKGIDGYNGSISRTFDIIPEKAVLLTVMSPKARAVKLTWKKDSRVSGYQIQFARNSRFTKDVKTWMVPKKSIVTKTVTKLSRHKKYYVHVRSYKKVKGRKYYSEWSKTKKVKCR